MENRLVDIEVLSNHVDLLIDLSKEITSSKIEYTPNDSFAFMSLCFLTKQIDHCRSIRFLINVEQFSDTMIIARVMMEGLVTIAWCYKNDPDYYASLWCNYAAISDFRLYNRQNKEKIPKDLKENILSNLESLGGIFLTEESRKNNKKNRPTQKFPYSYNWLIDKNGRQIKISKLFEQVEIQLLEIYSDMSGWIHWDIGSIGQKVKRENGKILFKTYKPEDGALSLISAYQSLYGLIEIVDYHFKLGFKAKLEKLKNDCISSVNKLKKSNIS